MKKQVKEFIKKGLLLVIIFLIILSLLNFFYIKIILPQKNIYKTHIQYLENKDKKIDVIFFGDSHPRRAANPAFINNSFNFALSAETPEQTYYKVQKVLNETSADIFVLPIEFHTFMNWVPTPYYEVRYWSEFMSIDELSRKSNHSMIYTLIAKHYPVIGKGQEFSRLVYKKGEYEIINGWESKEGNFSAGNDKNYIALKRAERQLRFPGTINEGQFESFIKITDMLKEENKTIVLIKYPLTDEYIKAAESMGFDRTEHYQTIISRLKNIGYEKIYLLDYQELYRYNQSLFSDSDHLNPKGSSDFSKRVNNNLNNLENFSINRRR